MIKTIFKGGALLIILAVAAFFLWPEKAYKPYQVDADYQAQVDAFNFPDMPPDWTWKSFTAQDGTTLRWGETGNADAARASVIWVPGYTASFDMYGEHVDMLARRGYHIIGIDMRGQGGSDRYREDQPEKLWVHDFADYSNDLAAFIKSLALGNDRPVILTGISFGGHVVTRTLGDHELPIDGAYLLAPALRPLSTPYTFEQAKKLMEVSRKLGKAKHYVYGQANWQPDGLDFTQGSDCASNPKRLYLRDVLFTRHPEQRVGGITNQYGSEFFQSSDYVLAPGYLEKIELAITMISAENDTFVSNDHNANACSERFPNCREVKPAGTGHCLSQESDEVLAMMWRELDALVERAVIAN